MNEASTAPDTPKVRTRPRETPRATKRLQKVSKGPLKEGGPQDARTRNEKCDFFGTEIDGFFLHFTPAGPGKPPGSPQKAPRATKRLN